MRFFKTDFKRIFTEPAFYLSIALGAILLFGAMAYQLFAGTGEKLYTLSQALALPFVAPLLASMPYSVMIMQERETLYVTLMTIKLRKSGYELQRFFTAGISGAVALFIPQFALFWVCAVLGGVSNFGNSLAELILPITFGFGYAAFSYGLTFVNKQRYVPLVMPQVLYMLCIYAFPYIGLERFYPPLDISPSINGGVISSVRFVVPTALTAAGLFLTVFGIIKTRRFEIN
ncbi:MAG: hypothetical protein K2J76_09595 [Oscillospiraceae bacterium]|nr:hypothetical protein [Oscillospiraceae bacterium]